VVIEAGGTAAGAIFRTAMPRQGDQQRPVERWHAAELAGNLEAAHAGQADIEDHHVRDLVTDALPGGGTVCRDLDVVSASFEEHAERGGAVLAVIDQQDLVSRWHAGRAGLAFCHALSGYELMVYNRTIVPPESIVFPWEN
jgi:hypothetical protein